MKTESEVFVFHDETKSSSNQRLSGHILLFVPTRCRISPIQKTLFGGSYDKIDPMTKLFNKMKELRSRYGANYKFHFTDISGKKWKKYNEAEKQLVEIGVDALRSKNPKIFSIPLYCKLAVIFYQSPAPDNLAHYTGDRNERILRFNETIIRMLLKGAVHYLYDENNKVRISKIITDGMPYHRKLSEDRILWKLIEESLKGNLRGYVDIPQNAEILHLDSNHRNYGKDSQEYIYANMLQLADMLLGSVIQSCFKGIKWRSFSPRIGEKVENKKSIIAYPIKEMLDKRKRGRKFKHSSHYKSFVISRAYTVNGKWQFENITTKEIIIERDTGNMTLLDFAEAVT